MSMPYGDIVNAIFEIGGGLLIWINVNQIAKDKKVFGVHWAPTAFFFAWGVWNLFYYPSLDQYLSFIGGLVIVCGNAAYVYLLFKYWKVGRDVQTRGDNGVSAQHEP